MSFIDLEIKLAGCHTSALSLKEMKNEFRTDNFLSINGFSFLIRVSPMCRTLQWQLQNKEFLLLGPVSMHGLCPVDLSGKSQGYRDLPSSIHTRALSHGHSRESFSKYTGTRQSSLRLAHIRRLCPSPFIRQAQELYVNEPFGLELDQTVYALDATMIDLCLSLFPWAHFCKTKGAIKLHTLLDLRGSIPTIIFITHGKIADVKILDELPIQTGALYIMVRGYQDYGRLFKLHLASAFFVIRVRKDFKFKRIYSQPIYKSTGLQCDQIVRLGGYYAKKDYPEKLRRVCFYDTEQQRRLVFLTNNFTSSALTIAQLYKCRWQIEIFFKWIKQHLRIKAFYGASENAVKTQIWIAISVYVLVAIIKKKTKSGPEPLHNSTDFESQSFRKSTTFTNIDEYELQKTTQMF
jgi:hypothetical protein